MSNSPAWVQACSWPGPRKDKQKKQDPRDSAVESTYVAALISEVNSLEHSSPADLLLLAQSDLRVIPGLQVEKGQAERKLLFG